MNRLQIAEIGIHDSVEGKKKKGKMKMARMESVAVAAVALLDTDPAALIEVDSCLYRIL